MSATEPTYRAPALDKGLDVLECLAAANVPMTQAQIARDLDRQSSELFRTLTTLERRSYLARDPVSGAYSPTLRLFALGHAHTPYDTLIRTADTPMRTLTAETGFACHLGVLDGEQLIVLHQIESPARVRVSVAVGSSIRAHDAAGGRVLLALRDPLDETWTAIRDQGYEAACSESVEGLSDLSVPVGASTAIRAALTITALVRDHDAFVRTAIAPLRRHASAITQSAGLQALARKESDHVR